MQFADIAVIAVWAVTACTLITTAGAFVYGHLASN